MLTTGHAVSLDFTAFSPACWRFFDGFRCFSAIYLLCGCECGFFASTHFWKTTTVVSVIALVDHVSVIALVDHYPMYWTVALWVKTFSSSTSQTKIPLKDTIKGALHGLDIDPFQLCGLLNVVGNCCPVQCLPTVAEETFQWMKTLLRNDKGYVKLSTYRFTLSESWPKLRPSQLYQASILNCIRRAIAEGNQGNRYSRDSRTGYM